MHSQSISQILEKLNTSKSGLTEEESKIRLKKDGPNQLPKSKEKITRFGIFLQQFKSPLMIILIVAGAISGLLHEYIDMTVILITVFINSVVGFFQEDKANKALEHLNKMIAYKAIVLRDGKPFQVLATKIVKGDILLIEAGDKIQADARIINYTDLEIDESSLTGESEPQIKHDRKISDKTILAERKNMVYRGTTVANGRATVLVVATGKDTEIGQIASLVKDTVEDKTPLQEQISKLAKWISIIVLFICLSIFAIGIFSNSQGESLFHIFEIAIAVAVAAIPEGLMITMTVILAIGMQFILKRKALVRRLLSAETLGSVSVICTDKTGTITEGKMRLTELITSKEDLNFEEIKILRTEKNERREDALMLLRAGVLANNGILENSKEKESEWKFLGDSTDIAFVYAGIKAGFERNILEKSSPRIDEIPFDSRNKFMATLHHVDHESVLYAKGAPEWIFKNAKYYEEDGKAKKMTDKQLKFFKEQAKLMTAKGLRVLAVAYKRQDGKVKKIDKKELDDLVFIGLAGLSDPIRKGVKKTIEIAKQAGIKTVMITGDNLSTAQAIAGQIGIPNGDEHVFDGARLETITDDELQVAIKSLFIYARVDPKHKIRIVRAWQANGEVVAMTGDGVNDAPALKAADIGVALGSGTDVAKEISDMVLLDDHYGTIVSAVDEGRTIYQNIKKVVLYLISGSFAEALLIVGSMVAGMPLAALPVQILWINIVEDAFPNIALAFDKGDKENMQDPPRRRDEKIIDKEMKIMIILKSLLANIALFAIFVYFYQTTGDIKLTRTIVFVGFGIDALFYIFAIRSLRHFVWETNPFGNKYLLASVAFGWAMLLSAIYVPFLQTLLRTVPLSLNHWILMIGFGIFNLVLIETVKWFFIHRKIRNV